MPALEEKVMDQLSDYKLSLEGHEACVLNLMAILLFVFETFHQK